jgi:hypothetical protein
MPRYWIYENWTAESKAVIHRGECSFCITGKGIHPQKEEGRNGQWHGPFNTYAQVYNHALSMNRPIKNCYFCKPSSL